MKYRVILANGEEYTYDGDIFIDVRHDGCLVLQGLLGPIAAFSTGIWAEAGEIK